MWIACTILVVAVLSATLVGIRAVALAGRRLASAILPVVVVVTRVVRAWPTFLGSLSLAGFSVHPKDTMRVASGRSVTMAVFVPMSLSIKYNVYRRRVYHHYLVCSQARARCPESRRIASDSLHFRSQRTREPEEPVPMCACKSICPDLPIPSKRSLGTHGSPMPARTKFTSGRKCLVSSASPQHSV